ncbi:MAG: phosphopyruvate hydratase [Massiliimalia sp.]
MKKCNIEQITARSIFDSRGNPTVEAEVALADGTKGIASVPSGASTGQFEACELRDNLPEFSGKGVSKAVEQVNTAIADGLRGMKCDDQQKIDRTLIQLDGTKQKSNLGANGILAVSLACAKAAAAYHHLEFYQYVGGSNGVTLPMPMMNILNGGAHANNNVDIQEFMIMPVGACSFTHAMRICVEVYHALGQSLKEKGLLNGIGDEGGFAPNLENDEMALMLLMDAVEKAGYRPYEDVCIALDAAASEWYHTGHYQFPKKKKRITQEELISWYEHLCSKYPIISIEDPLAEEDFVGFEEITRRLGGRVRIVGDDLFVTNPERLQRGINAGAANAILIKPNQIGTLSETMEAIRLAKENGYQTILSHRSGETEDTSIADLAVGLNAGQIKTGAPARTDRVCKYNRLLKIEAMLGESAVFGFQKK